LCAGRRLPTVPVMAEETPNLVLEHLPAIRDELREIREEQREQRGRLGSIERSISHMTREMGEMSLRLDWMHDRLDRIERRLDLVEAWFRRGTPAPRSGGSRGDRSSLAPYSCQSLPLARTGGQALDSRFRALVSGAIASATDACSGLISNIMKSSCAGLSRVSTSLFPALEGVDGRAKPGQDETGEPIPSLSLPQNFPRTALRFRGHDDQGFNLVDVFSGTLSTGIVFVHSTAAGSATRLWAPPTRLGAHLFYLFYQVEDQVTAPRLSSKSLLFLRRSAFMTIPSPQHVSPDPTATGPQNATLSRTLDAYLII
jgi:hypothetical protein